MSRTAFLFPGQGSQSPGMLDHLSGTPEFRILARRYSEASGTPGLAGLVAAGPEDLLTRTDNAQPAITMASLITLAVLESRGIRPDGAAGHSLGEYSALAAAGVIGPGDAMRLTRRRGELMQACADRFPGGMLAVIGASPGTIEEVLREASAKGPIGVANINSPGQTVLSGSVEAVAAAREAAAAAGVRRVIPLKVSGAWHSPLMAEAAEGLAPELDATRFGEPAFPVVANVTAGVPSGGAEHRALLVRQVTSPVLWADSMSRMVAEGFDVFVEVGPGAVLQGLLKGFEGVTVLGTGTAEALEDAIRRLGGD
jgi:[acyl-carrier-protein] S-malonyltransferase